MSWRLAQPEEKSSGGVRRMSLSLPGDGYGNTFVDERENNMDKKG